MRNVVAAAVVLTLVACGGTAAVSDAGVDGSPDAPGKNLYGQPCDLPAYKPAITFCRDLDPTVYCVDEDMNGDLVGTCRPKCDELHPQWNPVYVCTGPREGGTPTWTSDGVSGLPYVCYCKP